MTQHTYISTSSGTLKEYLNRIVKYHVLIPAYAKKDIRVKYAQSKFGILWSLLHPLASMVIFTLFFDKLLNVGNTTTSYPLFSFSGIMVWHYFSYIVSSAGTSLLANQDIIKKVYFPKIVLPLSKSLGGLFDFALSALMLILLLLVVGQPLSWRLIFIPIVAFLTMFTGLSLAIWLSALTIKWRDLQHVAPYLLNFGIWLTPVFYPLTIIPQPFQNVLSLVNPFVSILKLMRWILLQESAPSGMDALSFVWVLILLVSGLFYFKKVEKQIADFV